MPLEHQKTLSVDGNQRQPTPPYTDVPDKHGRPPAFDFRPDRYQWHFQTIPREIRFKNHVVPNPFRERAIYVVHGIGEQRLTETAATLRLELEDALGPVEPENWQPTAPDNWIVPEPFIYDGFWADYGDFRDVERDLLKRMSKPERRFFSRVWSKRALSAARTYGWLLEAAGRLFVRGRGIARFYYVYLVPTMLSVVGLCLPIPRLRRFVTGYLNDVRLYLKPRGDLEMFIVQLIERRVGAHFLKLLGLDWNLRPLKEPLLIFGEPHQFRRVTWVAHSLGSVISYNVIADILTMCKAVPPEDTERFRNARRVEESLEAFVTFGSPLDKIRFLYPEVLRQWPADYLPGGNRSLWNRTERPRDFWENFHYTSDPVSGRLDEFRQNGTSLVRNWHTRGCRIPGLSHLSYWHDPAFLKRVLTLTFSSYVKEVSLPTRSGVGQRIGLLVGSLLWSVIALLALGALVWYAGEWSGLWRLLGLLRH